MIRLIVVAVLLVIIGGALAAWYGRVAWRRSTDGLHSRMEAVRVPPSRAAVDAADLEGLPGPVRRYFQLVLAPGQRIVTGVALEHTGTFNMSETAARWRPFSSSQRVVTRRPGFLWNGRIAMAPAVPVLVHDAYVAGEGLLEAAMLGVIPVAELGGTPEMARGELMRFLAEAAWYPTALLPGQGVTWEAVDDSSARAILRDAGTVAELTFGFGADGLIASVRADARGRAAGGSVIPTPWEGRWESYERRDGMLVPIRGEVAWLLPSGRWPYWRGRITRVAYDFAR